MQEVQSLPNLLATDSSSSWTPEVIEDFLGLNLPHSAPGTDLSQLPIKIFDAEFLASHTRLQHPESFQLKLVTRLSKDEGRLWAQPPMLAILFFQERVKDREVTRSRDDQDRPIYGAIRLGFDMYSRMWTDVGS